MKNSKLIDLLQTFERTEISEFCDFVASPFFNKNEDLETFINYLERFAPEFPERKIKKEVVFKKIYPGEEFDPKRIAYLMNYLLKLGEQFLAIRRYQREGHLVNINILNEFIDRKLEKHYNYLVKKTKENLVDVAETNGEFFFYRYLLAEIETNYFISQRVREFDPSLQKVSDQLDAYYFFNKLKYSCEMLNRQSIISANYRLSFTGEVKSYLLQREENDPLINIYLLIFLSLSNPEEEHYFEQLMELIEEHAGEIDKKTRKEIYLYAINYCAPKIRKGREKYLAIMLNLYQEGIKNKSLFEGPYLTHWTFSNVVKLALRLERFNWIESFISKYSSSLAPQYREDAQHFNLADLYYHKKDYDQVLDHLNQLHFSDLHYHLGSRILLIKTYYETDDVEPLLSLLASFSVYLRRNKKISQTLKKTCLNFCNLMHQLMRNNPKKREDLREEIRSTQPLIDRPWLLKVWEKQGEKVW